MAIMTFLVILIEIRRWDDRNKSPKNHANRSCMNFRRDWKHSNKGKVFVWFCDANQRQIHQLRIRNKCRVAQTPAKRAAVIILIDGKGSHTSVACKWTKHRRMVRILLHEIVCVNGMAHGSERTSKVRLVFRKWACGIRGDANKFPLSVNFKSNKLNCYQFGGPKTGCTQFNPLRHRSISTIFGKNVCGSS